MNGKKSSGLGNYAPADLRRKAERRLRADGAVAGYPQSETDTRTLIHELQVHQIELEMQNEELHRASIAAEELSEKYGDLFDFAPIAYFVWDERGKIHEVNLAGAALLGDHRGKLLGKRFGQFVAKEDRGAYAGCLHQVMQAEKKLVCEVRLSRGDENVSVLIEAVAMMNRQHKQNKHCFAAVIDVTERKRLGELTAAKSVLETRIGAQEKIETELRRAKEAAEAANEAKTRFLANISHELRTPMNSILGMIDLARKKTAEPAVCDFLNTARDSADLLLMLLNDLLDSARIESGKFDLEARPFDLRRLMDLTMQSLSIRASERGLVCTYRVSPEIPEAFLGDQVRLRQILINLVGNAIKFTERGKVEVGVRLASLPEGEGLVELEFSVRDTGIGISSADVARLFQPFVQADSSTTRQFGGTGLGLSICSSLIAMMGGRIWVESEPGKGSTFYFTVRLPLARELPPEPESLSAIPAVAASLRVLLADDHPINRKLAAYLLGERGHQVEIAENGREALDLARENHYDVILMDVQMPGMDGLEATAAIRDFQRGKSRTPIIAMTAHAMKSDRDRCFAAGMDGYLSKPIDALEMFALVESLAASPASEGEIREAANSAAELENRPATPAFDPALALEQCFESTEMLKGTINYFFAEIEEIIPQMRATLRKGDLPELGRLGHRLMSTLVYLGAEPARKAAARVQSMQSSGGEQANAEAAVLSLERKCERLQSLLAAYLDTYRPE